MRSNPKLFGLSLLAIILTGCAQVQPPSETANKPEISADADILTMVNVITPNEGVTPEQVIEHLQAGMEQTMRRQAGFISASIHRSLDSDHVVVYAQWRSQADLEAVVKVLEAGKAPNILKAFTIATADYHPYKVVSVHTAP